MNHAAYREQECPDGNCDGNVQGTWSGTGAQSVVLVPDVHGIHDAAHSPRRESPKPHVIGREGKHAADEEVSDAGEQCRANPWLNWNFHVVAGCLSDGGKDSVTAHPCPERPWGG